MTRLHLYIYKHTKCLIVNYKYEFGILTFVCLSVVLCVRLGISVGLTLLFVFHHCLVYKLSTASLMDSHTGVFFLLVVILSGICLSAEGENPPAARRHREVQ